VVALTAVRGAGNSCAVTVEDDDAMYSRAAAVAMKDFILVPVV